MCLLGDYKPLERRKADKGVMTHYGEVSVVMALFNNYRGDAENHAKKS